MNTLAIISLLVLVAVVALGFVKKVNIGFMAIAACYILGLGCGLDPKDITGTFNSSLFITMVGVTFMFGIASINGTLDLMSKKIVALVGKRTYLIPILMFALSAFISAIGPGHVAAGVLMTTFAVYLAFEMKMNPFVTALFAKLGANAGCASPLSITGVLANGLSEPLGYSGFSLHLFLTTLLSGFVFTLILFIAYKSYKVRSENPLKLSDIPKFNRQQLITLGAIVVMVVCCIGLKLDTGLFAFITAGALILLGCADEKKAIKNIPIGTIMLIVGVGMLVSVIDELGGIQMISDFLIGMMTEKTAAPIMAATSGILSWVSSTTGVVMPAMYPIAAEVAETFSGTSYVELISAITATSFAAAISPLSTGGAIIMSSYSGAVELSQEKQNKMFRTLFLLSFANVGVNILMAALGVFNLGGLFY